MSKIVSVSGIIGAGKDTVSNYLIEQHGYTRISFSAILKDVVAALFLWDREMLEGGTKSAREAREQTDDWWSKVLGKEFSPRIALQTIATEVMRDHFHNDIWVLALQNRLRSIAADSDQKVVASDTRFLNELGMMHAMGGITLRVVRNSPVWEAEFVSRVEHDSFILLGFPIATAALDNKKVAEVVRGQLIRISIAMGIDTHVSDLEHMVWNKYHTTITNNGTLEDLYRKVDEVLELK